MKKLISSITVCSLAICVMTSCAAMGEGDKKLLGSWKIDSISNSQGLTGGIKFEDNGKGALFVDSSSILYFEKDGLNVGGTVLAEDYFIKTDKTLSVTVSGQEMLKITKLDDQSGYDGLYSLDGGLLYDGIVQGMAGNNIDTSDITIDFDGTHSEVTFNNFFTYEANGKKLKLSDYSFLENDDKDGYLKYNIKGDTLTLKGKNMTETLTKID